MSSCGFSRVTEEQAAGLWGGDGRLGWGLFASGVLEMFLFPPDGARGRALLTCRWVLQAKVTLCLSETLEQAGEQYPSPLVLSAWEVPGLTAEAGMREEPHMRTEVTQS